MPIDFQCPSCQAGMRLPDTAAGKQGKCPKCGAAVSVPAAGAAPAPVDDEFWSELDQDDKNQQQPEEDHGEHVPKTDAQVLRTYVTDPTTEEGGAIRRTGLPFEREGMRFEYFWDSAVYIMNSSQEAFSKMKLDGGLFRPTIFAIYGAIIGYILLAVYGVAIVGMRKAGSIDPNAEGAQAEINSLIVALVAVFFLLLLQGVVQATLGVFIQAGVAHAGLSMTGGAQQPFAVTFKVMGYTHGTIALCLIVPGIGPLLQIVLWLMAVSKGLAAAHGVPSGKAMVAVLFSFLTFIGVVLGPVGLILKMAGAF